MGEAGYGTAMYGEDTETFEVAHSGAGDAEDSDAFGYDEEPDDAESYDEAGDGFAD